MLSDTGCNKTMSFAACGVFSATFTHITLVGVEVGQFCLQFKIFSSQGRVCLPSFSSYALPSRFVSMLYQLRNYYLP